MQTKLNNTQQQYIQQREQLHKIVLMLGYNSLCPSIENAILETMVNKLNIDLLSMDGGAVKLVQSSEKYTTSDTITKLIKLSCNKPAFIFKLHSLLAMKIHNPEILLKHFLKVEYSIPSIVAYRLTQFIEKL
tara:strand:- start:1546 stop:1941 length:396 start_codon:yes stop_codon:yes gene_type:complete